MKKKLTQPLPKKCRYCGKSVNNPKPICEACEETQDKFFKDSLETEETYTDFSVDESRIMEAIDR